MSIRHFTPFPAPRSDTAADCGKPPVLLVDDDERNLLALSHVVEDIAEVVTATSGRDALRHLLNRDFAVILLDVFMPEMDGYEVASLIRQREQTARIPIIFLSAVNKDTEHLLRGYAMGAVDYVFKPVDSIVLKSKVSVFTDLYRMRQQMEANSQAEQALRDANFRAELEKLRMQRELDESRVRQAAIIHSLPIILYLEPESAAPRMPRFIGGNFDAVTGFPFRALEETPTLWVDRLHPDDKEHALSAIEERKRTGSMSIEYRWECADGQYRYFLDQAILLPDSAGEEPQYAGTLIDVSERKQLEAQLLQAGKLDAIGQLTGGIAHDFNNLLAAILGGIGLLERRVEFQPREQMIIQQMRHAAENGAELVRRMMAFARKQALRPERVSAQQLCQAVSGLVQHTLGGTVAVDWVCSAQRRLFVDKAQLELALVNLIINARDALPDGGCIEVRIEDFSDEELAAVKLKPGEYVAVRVIDHGIGVPREIIDRIVEPFFTTKEVGKGTGLGLSMVVGFAHQSGGKVNILSTPGEGTTVEMILPSIVREAEVAEPTNPQSIDSVERRHVLLVDDDDGVREVLGELLRDMNLEVTFAADGQTALNILQEPQCQVDILLTDFAMPGINGSETIQRAREIRPQLHSILMTGYADDSIVVRDLGATPLLRKPIDMIHLKNAIAGRDGEFQSAE